MVKNSKIIPLFTLVLIFIYPIKIGWLNNPFGIGFSVSIYRSLLAIFLIYCFFFLMLKKNKSIKITVIKEWGIQYYLLFIMFSLSITYFILLHKGGIPDYAYWSIFRNQYAWPITQFISFLVQAIIPALLVMYLPTSYYPKMLRVIYISIIFFTFYGIIQWILHRMGYSLNVMPEIDEISMRAYSVFAEPKMLGAYLVGSIIFIYYFVNNPLWRYTLIIISSILLILTLSTSAFISMFFILSFFVLKRINAKKIIIAISLAIILLFIVKNIPYFDFVFQERLWKRVSVLSALGGIGSTKYEIAQYSYGREIDGTFFYYITNLYQNPVSTIFGYGYGNIGYGIIDLIEKLFTQFDYRLQGNWRVHTRLYFYQLLVETGIIGLILYFLIHLRVYKMVNRFIKLYDKQTIRSLIALKYSLVAHLISSMVEVHFQSFIFMGTIILGMRYYQEQREIQLTKYENIYFQRV